MPRSQSGVPSSWLHHRQLRKSAWSLKTVNIGIAKNAGQCATMEVCYTASGIQLKSLVIFKGKPICVWYYWNIVYLILWCNCIRRRFDREREQQTVVQLVHTTLHRRSGGWARAWCSSGSSSLWLHTPWQHRTELWIVPRLFLDISAWWGPPTAPSMPSAYTNTCSAE